MRTNDRQHATIPALLIVALIGLTACGPALFERPAETANPIGSRSTMLPIASPSVASTPASLIPPADTPTKSIATPLPSQPRFSAAIDFATEPDRAKVQRVFRTGTRQVFAMWDYSNMGPNQQVRREWYRDNVLWLVREETWDYAKYGHDGTVLDVSVYDFETGLEPGLYTLRLYVDGRPQSSFENYPPISFRVEGTPLDPVSSPDGRRIALVHDPRVLVIQEADGTQRDLLTADEISSMAWLPDEVHLVYSNRLRAHQLVGAGTIFVQDELWIVDVVTGEQHQIGAADENLHTPSVSPDGQYLVVLSGTGWYDACLVDLSLAVVKLDSNRQRIALYRLDDFAGLPRNESGDLAAYPVTAADIPAPGVWLNSTQFTVGLQFACTLDNPAGIYTLDLTTQTARKTGNLEER